MTPELEKLADAILFEGYLLYPYQRSALKNQAFWPFGALYPEAFCDAEKAGDRSSIRLECLVSGDSKTRVLLCFRFLQLTQAGGVVRRLEMLLDPSGDPARMRFAFEPISGELVGAFSSVMDGVFKLCVEVTNQSNTRAGVASRADVMSSTMASSHFVLVASAGAFVSLLDPPEELRAIAASCRNEGTFPVLAGGTRQGLLAAPIILYDHPELAPESPGDLFDGTETDELLSLRILTLTDQEKRDLAAGDPHAKQLLERTESLSADQLRALHGRSSVRAVLAPGRPVRLRPRGRSDVFDLALAGRRATIESLEVDFEGRTHVVVTVDDDPGKDLGAYAHRFFFRPEEVEPL